MTPRRKLLLIDDDQTITDCLCLVLGGCYDVAVLHQPEQALAAVRRERPDLIVCDVEMPGMGGGEVARALAGTPDTASVALMFLTGAYTPAEFSARGDALDGHPGQSKQAPLVDIVARVHAEVDAALRRTG
ncbi:response regulator [Roseateles sp. MS654]|uniref:response regulator n=1 Tax=Roseateles sp. MS654 TaxID=3412685 RepID=UPI003C2E3AFB